MHCPFCHNPDSRVVDTRLADDGASIRRRRECTSCKRRFTTLETSSFQVVKRSGVVEPFSRDKVMSGVRKACQGRPVSEQDLAILAQQVEESLRSTGVSLVSVEEVGKAILPFLLDLDEIAYLRFASVYRSFKTLEDFETAIAELRAKDTASTNGTSGAQEREGDHVEAPKKRAPRRSPSSTSQSSHSASPTPGEQPSSPRSTPKAASTRQRRPARKRTPEPEDSPTPSLLDS